MTLNNKFRLAFIVALLAFVFFIIMGARAYAVQLPPQPQLPPQVCGNGQHVGNPHCITPTPTVTPTTVTPTPTVVQNPTPTVTPTPTQGTETSVPSNSSSVSNNATAPQPNICTTPIGQPLLQGFTRNSPTSVTFRFWGVANVDKYSVVYGYSENALPFGIAVVRADETSFTLNDLQPNAIVWAQVWAIKDGCVSKSIVLDP